MIERPLNKRITLQNTLKFGLSFVITLKDTLKLKLHLYFINGEGDLDEEMID